MRTLLVASKKTKTRSWYKAEPPPKEQWLGAVIYMFGHGVILSVGGFVMEE